MFRNLVWLAKVIIAGFERNWADRGTNSVGSVYSLMELAHTHFWDQSATLEQNLLSVKSKGRRVCLNVFLECVLKKSASGDTIVFSINERAKRRQVLQLVKHEELIVKLYCLM